MYACVRTWRAELWLGFIEGQQKSPEISGHGPWFSVTGQGMGMGKATKQLVTHAQLGSEPGRG